jgi:predicted alpha/beta-hydrolase family hydrolase
MVRHVVLDAVSCSNLESIELQKGEHVSHILENVHMDYYHGGIGPYGKDISGVSGSLLATTRRLIWLEGGSHHMDSKRTCGIPLESIEEVSMSTSALLRV